MEKSFLNKYLATLFKYNSWDLNIVAFFCRVLLTINSKVDIKFQPSTNKLWQFLNQKAMQEKRLRNKKDFTLTNTHWNSFFYDVSF